MRFIYILLLALFGCSSAITPVSSQPVLSKDFRLGSPFSEPDGRNDIVRINESDFITLAKVKGSQSGKSDFMLERFDSQLASLWQVPLSVESFEDYKDLYYNGKELILLSVIHLQSEKKTKLEAYAFDVKDGKKLWSKEMENFQVGDWENHQHKGKVKESFIDLICEHANQDFVTPFEYKHNISFSPDHSKMISYVYNYGEPNLTASVSVYDNSCNLLKRGKVFIDNDYTNYGVYVNNDGGVFILNANNFGKVNFIKFDLETKDFTLLELPSSNYQKDDFHVHFVSNDEAMVGNSEVKDGKLYGVMYSKFNFAEKKVDMSVFEEMDQAFKAKIISERKNNKQIKSEEDWLDYDITHFIVNEKEEVVIVLEKRALHADGYPHIGKDAFDKSHKVEVTGHVQTETVLVFSFNSETDIKWKNFLLKNQVYPVNDGLNSVSFYLDNSNASELRFLYATSENMDGSLHAINYVTVNAENGTAKHKVLPNDEKLTIVKDYSMVFSDNSIVMVGKKGLLGKTSMIVKAKP